MNTNRLYTFFIIFIAFFYPIIACYNYLAHSENNYITILYRGLSFFLAIYIISKEALIYKKFTIYTFYFLFFWIIYLIRYFSDIFIFQYLLIPANGQFYYFSQGFLVTFINMLAAFYAFKKVSINYFFEILYFLFILINFIITILVFSINRENLQDLFSFRFGLTSVDDERVYLNAITIGISAITLLLLILYKKGNNLFILLPSLISCFINLLISGSLGPLLALFLTFLLFLFIRFRYFYLLFSILLIVVIIFSSNFYNAQFSSNFILFSRVLQGSDAETVSTRSDLINHALNQFKDGIFFGTHYFTIKNYSSPHNLLIDILLSTGIFGFIFFLIPLLNILKIVIKSFLKSPIFPLFFMHLVLTQTSGYVFGATDFFIFMSIILSITSNKRPISHNL